MWPQQTGTLLRLISIIQDHAVTYETIFKILFEYECGLFLAVILTFASDFFFFFTIWWIKKLRYVLNSIS